MIAEICIKSLNDLRAGSSRYESIHHAASRWGIASGEFQAGQ